MDSRFQREGKAIRAEFGGEKRLFLYSFRVSKAVEEFNDTDIGTVDYVIWLAGLMMNAGKKYAERYGLQNPEPMSAEDMMDYCSEEEILQFSDLIKEVKGAASVNAIHTDNGTGDDADNGEAKNAEAKPGT